jgi:hypothetical protein
MDVPQDTDSHLSVTLTGHFRLDNGFMPYKHLTGVPTKMKNRSYITRVIGISLLLGSVALVGCSAKGAPPTGRIANTEMTIQQARESEAINYAPLELKLAEDNLKAAKAAQAEEEYIKAGELADKALADAILAEERSKAFNAKKVAIDLQDAIKTFQMENDRVYLRKN